MKRTFLFCSLAIFFIAIGISSCKDKQADRDINIIPYPNSVEFSSEADFDLSSSELKYFISSQELTHTKDYLEKALDIKLISADRTDADIIIKLSDTVKEEEGYTLDINSKKITISSKETVGAFYAIQSLLQIREANKLPALKIKDAPRFAYRGYMLDVSRHFMKKEHILSTLDMMARYKLNRFHWHLVDGGGWRMESKTYPKLQELASYRDIEDWDEWWGKSERKFVKKDSPNSYGGYYTQEEIKEIVSHAEKLHITVIPEIEMPGHSNELFHAYPELSCLGKAGRDVTEVCPSNEKVYDFFESILTETMELFPSKYIHIGGDEAARGNWNKCPRCQRFMKSNNIGIEELQSKMIVRIEKFLNKHGRQIIGWDEILDGGVAPGATVHSWRGETGGIKAAKMGHNVIMSPTSNLYIDHTQANPEYEPKTIGGYVPLKYVYDYDPVPSELTEEEGKLVLGAQANLWTEYVKDEKQAEYMTYPRLLALAEINWTKKENKDYDRFLKAVNKENKFITSKGINTYPLKNIEYSMRVDKENKALIIKLDKELLNTEIRYTLDGTMPTTSSSIYSEHIILKEVCDLTAQLFKDGKPIFNPLKLRLGYHHAIDSKVSYIAPSKYREQYKASGELTLTDGILGSYSHSDKIWQGFLTSFDVMLDLSDKKAFSAINIRFMHSPGAWIFLPEEVEFYISHDAQNWTKIGREKTGEIEDANKNHTRNYLLLVNKAGRSTATEENDNIKLYNSDRKIEARYVRIKASNVRPSGGWLFSDEILVY